MNRQKTPARFLSPRRLALIGALAALCAWMLPAAAASAAAPAWKLTLASNPTNFGPGSVPTESFPQYSLFATNVGSAPTSGFASITDTLPDGVTPVAATGIVRLEGTNVSEFSCQVSAQTVSCSEIGVVPAGRYLELQILVEVDAGTPPSVLNEASISGGGAGEAVARTTTTIDSASAPFGLISGSAGLSLAAIDSDGGPAIQVGSHPAQITIDTGLSTAVENKVFITTGHLHDLDVRLPRGGGGAPPRPRRCSAPRGSWRAAAVPLPPRSAR
jgi:hypothetical protein